jgi:hypothetical protein
MLNNLAKVACALASFILNIAMEEFPWNEIATPGTQLSAPTLNLNPRLAHDLPATPKELLNKPPVGAAFFMASADSTIRDSPSAQKSPSLDAKLEMSARATPPTRSWIIIRTVQVPSCIIEKTEQTQTQIHTWLSRHS